MLKYGNYCIYAILLLLGFIITLPQIQAAITKHIPNQSYDYIDVAKETSRAKSKGRTTRIFTTEHELDEAFWLKYLGEEYNDAVHLEVDRNNNIIPVENKPQKYFPKVSHLETNEKRSRFVRQPSKGKKLIPVMSKYPTEKPELFYDKQISKPTNRTTAQTTSHKNFYTHNNKIFNNKNKLFQHNKYKQKIIRVKPSSPLKAIHEPIVITLPELEVDEHQINDAQIPVVVQMPPVIYHQKADFYTKHDPNLPFNSQQHIHDYRTHIKAYAQDKIDSKLPQGLQHEDNLIQK